MYLHYCILFDIDLCPNAGLKMFINLSISYPIKQSNKLA